MQAAHTAQLLNNINNNNNNNATTKESRRESGMPVGSGGRGGRYDNDLHGNVNVLLGGFVTVYYRFLLFFCFMSELIEFTQSVF